jgi:hypothetical protein
MKLFSLFAGLTLATLLAFNLPYGLVLARNIYFEWTHKSLHLTKRSSFFQSSTQQKLTKLEKTNEWGAFTSSDH